MRVLSDEVTLYHVTLDLVNDHPELAELPRYKRGPTALEYIQNGLNIDIDPKNIIKEDVGRDHVYLRFIA